MLNRNIIDYEGIKDNVLQDHLAIGFGATGNNIKLTEIIGNEIRLTSTSGNVYIPNATSITKGLRIGDAIFYWDGNALALIKSDGTACNFYATGGVSALGLSPSSGSGSVSTMTFGTLDVTNSLKLKLNGSNKATIQGDTSNNLYLTNQSGWIHINGTSTYINEESGSIYLGNENGDIFIWTPDGDDYFRLDTNKLLNDGYLVPVS